MPEHPKEIRKIIPSKNGRRCSHAIGGGVAAMPAVGAMRCCCGCCWQWNSQTKNRAVVVIVVVIVVFSAQSVFIVVVAAAASRSIPKGLLIQGRDSVVLIVAGLGIEILGCRRRRRDGGMGDRIAATSAAVKGRDNASHHGTAGRGRILQQRERRKGRKIPPSNIVRSCCCCCCCGGYCGWRRCSGICIGTVGTVGGIDAATAAAAPAVGPFRALGRDFPQSSGHHTGTNHQHQQTLNCSLDRSLACLFASLCTFLIILAGY